jgi:hypothetical protein
VGQLVKFSVAVGSAENNQFSPLSPNLYTVLSNRWTFQGAFFNNFTDFDFPTHSYTNFIDTNMLKAPSTMAWWISGGDALHENPNIPTQYQVTCSNVVLHFATGTNVNLAALAGAFNMYRPVGNISAIKGSIIIDTDDGGNQMLSCGTSTTPGMAFLYSTNTPSNFPGTIKWVQILTSLGNERQYTSNGITFHSIENGPGPNFLDDAVPTNSYASYPYTVVWTNLFKVVFPADFPAMELSNNWTSAAVTGESFLMTMIFTPDGHGPTASVPLVAVPWNWSGSAVYDPNKPGWEVRPWDSQINPGPLILNPGYPEWGSLATDYYWTNKP